MSVSVAKAKNYYFSRKDAKKVAKFHFKFFHNLSQEFPIMDSILTVLWSIMSKLKR